MTNNEGKQSKEAYNKLTELIDLVVKQASYISDNIARQNGTEYEDEFNLGIQAVKIKLEQRAELFLDGLLGK